MANQINAIKLLGYELELTLEPDSPAHIFKCSSVAMHFVKNEIPQVTCNLAVGRDISDPSINNTQKAEEVLVELQRRKRTGESTLLPCTVTEYTESEDEKTVARRLLTGYLTILRVDYDRNIDEHGVLTYQATVMSAACLLAVAASNYQMEISGEFMFHHLTNIFNSDIGQQLLNSTLYGLGNRMIEFEKKLKERLKGASILKRVAMCVHNAKVFHRIMGGIQTEFEDKLDLDVLAAFSGSVYFSKLIPESVDTEITSILWHAICGGARQQSIFLNIISILTSPDFMLCVVPRMVTEDLGEGYEPRDVLDYIKDKDKDTKIKVLTGTKLVIMPDGPARKKPEFWATKSNVTKLESNVSALDCLRDCDAMVMLTNVPNDWGDNNTGYSTKIGVAARNAKLQQKLNEALAIPQEEPPREQVVSPATETAPENIDDTDGRNAKVRASTWFNMFESDVLRVKTIQAPRWAWACMTTAAKYEDCNQDVGKKANAATPPSAAQQDENKRKGKTDAWPWLNMKILQPWLNGVAKALYVFQRDANNSYSMRFKPSLHLRPLLQTTRAGVTIESWFDDYVGATIAVALTPAEATTIKKPFMLFGVIQSITFQCNGSYMNYSVILGRVRFYNDLDDEQDDAALVNALYTG